MAGLSPKRPKGSWISRYRRRCLSAGGATIIFVTFLAKDAARDQLKSLIDSIDAAENSFIIRAEQRKAFGELKSFEDDFADFREHPTVPKPRSVNSGGGDFDIDENKVDDETLLAVRNEEASVQETLDNIAHLERKIPPDVERATEFADMAHKVATFSRLDIQIDELSRDLGPVGDSKSYRLAVKDINKMVYALQTQGSVIYKGTDRLNRTILRAAEMERMKAESNYGWWEPVTYGLYAFGWIIGVISIFAGGEADPITEAIADEI
jgi:hypothetical protein